MLTDTSEEVMHFIIEGYRKMSPQRKLERVFDLNEALNQLARARIKKQMGDQISEREINLRIAALKIDRETMIAAFNFDPEKEDK